MTQATLKSCLARLPAIDRRHHAGYVLTTADGSQAVGRSLDDNQIELTCPTAKEVFTSQQAAARALQWYLNAEDTPDRNPQILVYGR